jgi:hypothetical protein
MILSTAAEANPIPNDPPSTILQHGRTVDTETVAQQGSEPGSSDDEDCLSDSDDPDPSSDDDSCSSEDEQSHSSTSKHSRWSDLDEQRLLAYRKEDKS